MKNPDLQFTTLIFIFLFSADLCSQTAPVSTIESFWSSEKQINIDPADNNTSAAKWTTVQPLPFPRYYGTSITDMNTLIIAGGDITGGGIATDIVTTYNVNTNTYGTLSSMPQTLRLSAGLKFQNSYRVLGGFTNGSNDPLLVHLKYDLTSSSWSSSTSLPIGTFYSRAVNYKDEGFYLIGGSDLNSNLLSNARFFRGSDETWNDATDLPSPSADGGAAMLDDNTLIYIGGFRPGFDSPLQVDSVFIGEIDPNNPLNITWTSGTNFPGGPRARIHAYSWGINQVIVVGGSDSEAFPAFADTWVYNHNTESWVSWTQFDDKPTSITAYQGGSFKLDNDTWKLVIAGGITSGPSLTAVNEIFTDTIPEPSGVKILNNITPDEFVLFQNYPNPFNPSTIIQFAVPEQTNVILEVFNSLGEKISTLISNVLNAGVYEYEWMAANLPSGIYYYRLTANGFEKTKKLMLIK